LLYPKTLILLNSQVKSSKIFMKNISLTEKLVLYFLIIGIGVISVISFYSFYSTKNALMSRTFDQLTSLRLVKKNQLEIFFGDRLKDLVLLANAEDTKNISLLLNSEKQKKNGINDRNLLENYVQYLDKYQPLKSYFSSIYLIGKDHLALKGFPDNNKYPEMLMAGSYEQQFLSRSINQFQLNQVTIKDMTVDPRTHQPVLFITAPVISGNKKIISWLFLEISIDAINKIMVNDNPKSGLGMTGETYLVGHDFKLRSSSRFIPNSILNTTVKTQPAINALQGEEGHVITHDYRNIPVLSSYSKISVPGLNWVILAEIDLKEAMIPIYRMRNSLFILSILISVVFFIFVFFTSKKITRPIILLRDAAMRIGKGQYDVDIPVRANDEIGALTRAFNTMSLQIKEKTRELQSERIGRLRSVIDAEESERQRLSREIHDGIGQSLIALKLRLESLLYIDGPEIKTNINILKNQFDGTVDEIRRISNNLMPSVLEAFGITIALRNLCVETEEHGGIKIIYETSGDLENINTKIKTYLFRIAQEAFNNIIKHSGAQEVEMKLFRIDEFVNFTIRDNGKGFDVNGVAVEKGNGLHNMRERVALLEGEIDIKSKFNLGTEIIIKIPVF
jgi:signal transduction histidine kinase